MKYIFASISWGYISAFIGWVALFFLMYLAYRMMFKRSSKVVTVFGVVLILTGILMYVFRGFMSIEYQLTDAQNRNALISGSLVSLAGILIIIYRKKLAKKSSFDNSL